MKIKTYHQQTPLKIIAFPVTQEVANNDDREHKEYDHENLEVEVHVLAKKPANNDDKRSIEQCCLDRGADAMEESKVLGVVN